VAELIDHHVKASIPVTKNSDVILVQGVNRRLVEPVRAGVCVCVCMYVCVCVCVCVFAAVVVVVVTV
jgi:hypothetical protein